MAAPSARGAGCGVVVRDGQNSGARAAERGAASGARERDVDGLRPAGQTSVEDRDADVLGARITGGPVERLGDGRVIGARMRPCRCSC